MTDKWKEPITQLVKLNGALGVNALANALNAPVSSVQKYLTAQQTYFKKTSDRKWDLPERVIGEYEEQNIVNTLQLLETQSTIIKNQLGQIHIAFDSLVPQLKQIKSLVETYTKPKKEPDTVIDPRLLKFTEEVTNMQLAIRKNTDKVPEIYRDLLSNIDFLRLALSKGKEYVNDYLIPELSRLIFKEIETLQPETISLLTEFQINSKVTNRAEEN